MCLNEVCKFCEGGMHLTKLDCTKMSAEESQEKKKHFSFYWLVKLFRYLSCYLNQCFYDVWKFMVGRTDPVKGNREQELWLITVINHQNHSLVFTIIDGKAQVTCVGFSYYGEMSWYVNKADSSSSSYGHIMEIFAFWGVLTSISFLS